MSGVSVERRSRRAEWVWVDSAVATEHPRPAAVRKEGRVFRFSSRTGRLPRCRPLLGAVILVSLLVPAAAEAAPFVYATNNSSTNVSQFGVGAGGFLAPLVPPMVKAGDFPLGVAVSPNGKSLYVANVGRGDFVSQYDVGAGGQLSPKRPATVPAGVAPTGIALAVRPGGLHAYVVSSIGVSQFNVGPLGAPAQEADRRCPPAATRRSWRRATTGGTFM